MAAADRPGVVDAAGVMIDYVDPPPPDWKRTRRLLLLLIVTVIAAVAYSTRAEPILDCLGDVAELEQVTIQTGNRNRPLTDAQLEAIAAIEGESIWIGYEHGGWDYPDGIEAMSFTRYWIFGKRDGVKFWVILYIGAEWSYGFTFANTEPYADANGEHYGQHPCDGYAIDGAALVEAVTAEN